MLHLKVLVLGRGLVAKGVSERVTRCGHQLVNFLDLSREPFNGLSSAAANSFIAETLLAHPHDLLLSVGTPFVLNEQVLSIPRLAAINYHNSLLPSYAGLNATAWAIFNGEAQHGITWHIMTETLDAGAILTQRSFDLKPLETTKSLDIRCSRAAIESVADVLEAVSLERLVGKPQGKGRTYYGERDAAPDDGIIHWTDTAIQIERLVRACDGGKEGTRFGKASVQTPNGLRRVTTARLLDEYIPAGTVFQTDSCTVRMGCTDGAIELFLADPCEAAHNDFIVADVIRDRSEANTTYEFDADHKVRKPSVPERVRDASLRRKSAVAITDPDRDVTFDELILRSNSIARKLIDNQLKTGAGVGVLLPAGTDFVIAALAAMEAGGAYVPLDPNAPMTRRSAEIMEAGVSHILTTSDFAPLVTSLKASILLIDGPWAQVPDVDLPTIKPNDCAYRIFTSGSTGRPKAVEISHSALNNLVDHVCNSIPFDHDDRMTFLFPTTFDAAVFDIWPILVAGGTLLVPPNRIMLHPKALIEWLSATKATCASVPTAIAERIIALDWPTSSKLHTLIAGGDALHRRPVEGLSFKLINSYGPTENTVSSMWAVVTPHGGTPPIGYPITGVTAAIIDPDGRRLAEGELGEIVLGGAQIALGYRGREDLTRERFEPDPDRPGFNRYRTGDMGFVDEAGAYHFCGRVDNQVQLLGRRIELEGLEAIVMQDDRVEQAVCVPIRKGGTVIAIEAHIAVNRYPCGAATLEDIRTKLAERVEPGSLPRRLVAHKTLPITVAGKVDRKALDYISNMKTVDGVSDAILDNIDALWWRALARNTGDDKDTFWDLGGDSLSAIDLLMDIENLTGVRISVGTFFAEPTLAGVKYSVANQTQDEVVQLKEGLGPPLVLFYGYSGDLEVYRHIIKEVQDRQILGIVSPALRHPDQAPKSLEDAAERALNALNRFGVSGPSHFVGYSWGGLVAFEAARQLAKLRRPPALVALIGSLPPSISETLVVSLKHAIQQIPRLAVRVIRGEQRLPWNRITEKTIGRFKSSIKPRSQNNLDQFHLKLSRAYNPRIEPVYNLTSTNVILFRESSSRNHVSLFGNPSEEAEDYGWSRLAATNVEVCWVEGDHSTFIQGVAAMQIAKGLAKFKA